MEKIKVTARFRPSLMDHESIFTKDQSNIKIKDKNQKFYFDEVFDEKKTNDKIFNTSIKDYIDSSLKGYNFTLFAYGQTGSGKTHTMLGPQNNKADQSPSTNIFEKYNGLLIYGLIHLFKKIEEDSNSSYFVKCCYMEIYNDYVYDLLDDNNDSVALPIHENKKKEFVVKGLKEENVSSVNEALYCLQKGELLRKYSESLMKHQSSRSHTIFQIKIKKVKNKLVEKARAKENDDNISTFSEDDKISKNKNSKDSQVIESIINFTDLAGSERTPTKEKQENYNDVDTEEEIKSKAKGLMKEGKYINKSLFFLTRVISLLAEKNKKNQQIPFRDSALTKILKNSLGGNSRTIIILNLHNDEKFLEEGLSTLRFGQNAKRIVNKVQANILTKSNNRSLQILIRNYEQKIMLLQNSISESKKKTIKMGCIIDELVLEKINLKNEINNENKNISQKSIINPNNEKIKKLLLDSENIVNWQNKIIKKMFEFSEIYLNQIKIITNEYQEEFILSNEQKIKLSFYEKLQGFTMMSDNDLINLNSYIENFTSKLKNEQKRRIELKNENNLQEVEKLKEIANFELKDKNELLDYFKNKFQTFINLKSVCNNELENLNSMIKEHTEIIKVNEFLEKIKNISNEKIDENNMVDNMLNNFQSKFNSNEKKNNEEEDNKSINSKKRLFKNQSMEVSESNFKSTFSRKNSIKQWKEGEEVKKKMGVNLNFESNKNIENNNPFDVDVIKENENENDDSSCEKKKKIEENKSQFSFSNRDSNRDISLKNENMFNTLNTDSKKNLKRTNTDTKPIKIKKKNKTQTVSKKVSAPNLNNTYMKYKKKKNEVNNNKSLLGEKLKKTSAKKVDLSKKISTNKKPIKLMSTEMKFRKSIK